MNENIKRIKIHGCLSNFSFSQSKPKSVMIMIYELELNFWNKHHSTKWVGVLNLEYTKSDWEKI